MVALVIGILVGGSVTVIVYIIRLGIEPLMDFQEPYRRKSSKGKFITIAAIVISSMAMILSMNGLVYAFTQSNYQWIEKFKAQKYTIETSITTDSIGGPERLELVKSSGELNGDLASRQYAQKQWWGFDIPETIQDLEPIRF